MKNTLITLAFVGGFLAGCTAEETVIEPTDFAFDGTCVNCHAGLSAGHVHTNYKLRCVDCHGGDDTVAVAANAFENKNLDAGGGGFRDPVLVAKAHVTPGGECSQKLNGEIVQCNGAKDCPGQGNACISSIARFFYANGVDDDGDGLIDEPPVYDQFPNPTQLIDQGEIFEPQLHGEGPGEFMDMELNRDLNYTRFYNPGDLRVASLTCGGGSRAAFDGGGNGSCHQQTIDIVRRSIMVNQAAVTNGAYYGNETARVMGPGDRDPRFGAFGYQLDYTEKDSVDKCIKPPPDPKNPRSQPFFDKKCLQDRAASQDNRFPEDQGGNTIVGGIGQGNIGVNGETPFTFEIAQGLNVANPDVPAGQTLRQAGAGDTRFEWGGNATTADVVAQFDPLLNGDLLPGLIPDPVDNILRTFRAYYPLNYPASTNNFNFTFGTSILPEIKRFRTGTAYGRGHSSGCSACHTPYNYEGNREPQIVRQDDGTLVPVSDPTTKHREFDPTKDRGPLFNVATGTFDNDRLIGRPVRADEVLNSGPVAKGAVDLNGDGKADPEQERAYSAKHQVTAKIDTDTCGLCHGFVTRINYAYQGMAEEEQRDALSRRKPVEFTTPKGTKVIIQDSWVREDFDPNNTGTFLQTPVVVFPKGADIAAKARKRDADLALLGFTPGSGGCAAAVFSEDCNNDGELETNLVLEKKDVDGNVLATTTINEDLDGDGKLSLIDRLPREKAIDGRQVRYVYGGRNGSTRQMDIHFQVGMHCIDCHFLQDTHGDGNIYSTNWDAIEIECEDCHGALSRTNFKTSGPNGGNDLRKALNEDLLPFFEERDGKVIQRSRVTSGLEWVVPQTVDVNATNAYAREAHADQHVADPGKGSEFAGVQGESEMLSAKVECASCHNGYILNCLGCHVDINVGDKQRDRVFPDGHIEKSAGENEIWLSNRHNPGHINFQLMALLRSPFVMGVGSNTEQGRLMNVRSSMQVHASATDATGSTLRENLTFTTFQTLDGNSGRSNVATSGIVMNQTMPHTVRPVEARGCEMCHSLVDDSGRIRNEHVMAQTFGLGTGSLPFTGDWIIATGTNGVELYEYKQERELANNLVAGASQRFPGIILNPNTRTLANVEPVFDGTNGIGAGSVANDVVLIRNFNPTPGQIGGFEGPTLRDFAVMAVDTGGGTGRLLISDISLRGHPTATRPSVGNLNLEAAVVLPEAGRGVAHLASDVSDPFVYVAHGNTGISVVQISDAAALSGPITATRVNTTALANGETANVVALAGDFLYVGTAQGSIQVFDINNPTQPVPVGSANVGQAIRGIQINGFTLYAATAGGLAILSLSDPANPTAPEGAGQIPLVGPPAFGVYVSEGHAFTACGAQGIHEIDARTVAAPVDLGAINTQAVDVTDVIVSQLPGQKWVIGLESAGTIVGVKLDNTQTKYERCYPDPGAGDCILELEMFDATNTGKDPSFDPVTGTFDSAAVDPSAITEFRMGNAIINNGRKLARPTLFESIGTLSGRRYRDSFMPGAGVMSLGVMQSMHAVQVCERNGESTNPSGINELGYFDGNNCLSFEEAPMAKRKKPVCNPKQFGPGIRGIVCEQPKPTRTASPDAAKPAPKPKTAGTATVAPAAAALLPGAAVGVFGR